MPDHVGSPGSTTHDCWEPGFDRLEFAYRAYGLWRGQLPHVHLTTFQSDRLLTSFLQG